jgi:hypothetical protein
MSADLAPSQDLLRRPLKPGEPIVYWELGETAEQRYDVAERPGRQLEPVDAVSADEEAAHGLLDDAGLLARQGHVGVIGRAGP